MDSETETTETTHTTLHARRNLATLRQRWKAHGPASPLCLSDELEPGVTIAEFCVQFLLAQRSRRTAPEEPRNENE